MIIQRYLNREASKAAFVVLMVLLLLFMGQRFVLYLGDAAQGLIGSNLVLSLLLFQLPVFVSYLLPLSLFIGLLIALGNLYANHEITVLKACGYSPKQLLKSFMPLAIFVSLISGYLTLFQVPYAVAAQQQMIAEQERKGDLSLLREGRFQQSSDSKTIIYVERIPKHDELEQVFFAQEDPSEQAFSIIFAERGRFLNDPERGNFLVLENGHQYGGNPGNRKFQMLDFESYFMAIKSREDEQKKVKLKAIGTLELLKNPTVPNQGELQWRLSAPLSVPLLLLVALPLARVNPRQGKFGRLLPGMLVYLCYAALLIMMRSSMEEEKLSPIIGTWWVHLLMFAYAWSEYTNWQWLKKRRNKPQSNGAKT
ncbi:MAG: LPS export ABC transporter permease LptF [Gammaproteobacteria bacterium]|nr:LPS export ABC transporter permease LptF [Gammaproteobacteria bacterium]NNJ71791.1 LPS export ABC transporter permease LptF [Enterobacterales bacterium]